MSAPGRTERIEPLNIQHDRSQFSCGVDALDRYFHLQAGQDARRRVAACFVLTVDDAVAGYSTLSATSVLLAELPAQTIKKLPRYPSIPGTLMGRLAVDRKYRGKGFGEALLFDAFSRALRSEIATYAFVVDAKDDAAEAFYARYDFTLLPGTGRRLFKPLSEIAALFG